MMVMTVSTTTLTTTRFTCRPLREGDEDAFFPAFSNEQKMLYWSCGPFTDRAAFREYFFDEKWRNQVRIAEPREGGAPVFYMSYSTLREQVAEIGYMLIPGNEGQGIARECVSAMITQLFGEDGFHRIHADVDPRNTPSARLLLNLGFTREAHLRDAMMTHIGWCDSWLFGLLCDEWAG